MTAYGIALQQDGKILTVGTSLNRYQASGRPDPSFGLDGRVDIHGGKVRVLNDGKIVTLSADNQGGFVTRLYPNGRIDSTYGANGIARLKIRAPLNLQLQAGGGLLVSGNEVAVELQRLRPDGRVDSSFGINGYVSVPSGGYASSSLPGLDTLSDGRIVVAGMGYVQWTSSAMLMRFLRNGTLDSSFGNNGKTYPFASDFCRDMALQKDGKILASFGGFNGNSLFRFQSDGTLDLTYGQGGECELPQRTAYFKLLDSGKIICAGSDGAFVVARLKPEGTGPDSSFGTYGITRTDITPNERDRIWTMIVQPDGNILAAGQSRALDNSWWDRLTMVRYHGTPPAPPTNSVASISLPAPELYPNPSSTTFTLRGIVPGLFGNS